MTKEQLAALLDGREIGSEMTNEEEQAAAADGLVVVYGASDDLCELRGAISDEEDCYNGGSVLLMRNKAGVLDAYQPACDSAECPHELAIRDSIPRFTAIWCDPLPGQPLFLSWRYEIPWSHATFRILEGEDVYCIGAVFHVDDVPLTHIA